MQLYDRQLSQAIADAAALGRQVGLVDVDAEVKAQVEDLRAYENHEREAEAAVQEAQARLAQIQQDASKQGNVTVSEQPVPNPAWQAAYDRVTQAQLDLRSLQARYTDSHPRVQDQKALIQQVPGGA